MYIILTYDVKEKQVAKVMKICRKYLVHVQKSVFEGIITEGKLKHLKQEIQDVIMYSEDKVSIYELESSRCLLKEEIGVIEKQGNII